MKIINLNEKNSNGTQITREKPLQSIAKIVNKKGQPYEMEWADAPKKMKQRKNVMQAKSTATNERITFARN